MPETQEGRPSPDELRTLPRRAIVAFAVRCARRVQPLLLAEGGEENRALISDVEKALRIATDYVSGETVDSESLRELAVSIRSARAAAATEVGAAANCAANCAAAAVAVVDVDVDVDVAAAAAADAATAARYASYADYADVDPAVAAAVAARRDINALVARVKSHPKAIEKGFSCSERSFLGKYWGEEAPDWYVKQKVKIDALLKDGTDAPNEILESRNHQIRELDCELKELFADKESLSNQLEQAQSARSELSDQLSEANQQSAELKRSLDDINRDAELAELDKQRIESQLAVAQANRKEDYASISGLQGQVSKLQLEVDNYKREAELNQPQKIGWYFQHLRAPRTWITVLSMSILIVFVIWVINIISHIRARQQLEQMLASRIGGLHEAIATSRLIDSNDTDKAATVGGPSASKGISDRQLIQELGRQRSRLQALSLAGSTFERDSFDAIRDDVQTTLRTGEFKSVTTTESNGVAWYRWAGYSSDFLLSLVVIFSGSVGALIAAIRGQRILGLHPRDIAFGFAAGFVTLLALRGGKNVMVLQDETSSFQLNPYASAFLGLMAGVFTEKAYRLLNDFAETLFKGIKTAFNLQTADQVDETLAEPSVSSKRDVVAENSEPHETAPDATDEEGPVSKQS